MGKAVTLLLAALVVGGGPLAEDADDQPNVDLEAHAPVDPPQSEDPSQQAAEPQAPAAASPTADADAHLEASSDGQARLAVQAETAQTSLRAEASHVKVRLESGRLLELTYTPPELQTPGVQVPSLEDSRTEDTRSEEPSAAGTSQTEAPTGPDVDLSWAIPPMAGLAAAGAVVATATKGAWLRRLLPLAPWAPLYSRISRSDVLDHETRETIYAMLQEEPGLSLEAICERLDIARSTARHHVRKLEAVDMVDHTRIGRSRVHYPVGQEDEARQRHLLDNPTRSKVYEALSQRPRNLTEVAEAIDVNPGSVHFHVNKLVEAELVEPTGNGDKRYRAAETGDGQPRFEPPNL